MKDIDFSIKTEDFEGPLDLFLHLIDNKKIDISNIVISEIIDDYLKIIENETSQNLKIKVEFLAMASEILEIKAYSILSVDKKEEKEQNLEQRILEYKIIKDLAQKFSEREIEFNFSYRISGNNSKTFENVFYTLDDLKLETISKVFNELMKENKKKVETMKIEILDDFNTEKAMFEIETKFKNEKEVRFSSLFKGNFSKNRIVSFFLAVLDLFKNGEIDIYSIDDDFYIRKEKNV
ncbi:segregation and condensation protein A [Pseudostreptobacillus hongkongensis]|uniref:segregation and condensation protein A n=1 Tax=Pseudostreptobacillus hongkongensis TaxID=1162717 RepID=UPI00083593AB|nr:segregation/condensation protein A [Pseudostreptobacillus hongkongensis]